MQKKSLLFISLVLLITQSIAQAPTKFTINGYVKDSASGEFIIGASIAVAGKTVSSNQYGFYSLTLDAGDYDLTLSHVSYTSQQVPISLQQNVQRNFFLVPKTADLSEIIVYSKRRDLNVRNAQMGQIDLSINQIKNIPAFMGEVDILKAIQLLPGVRNAGEGNAGFYVRGGGPDQNLIMLDDAVVYNTGHLFGFFFDF